MFIIRVSLILKVRTEKSGRKNHFEKDLYLKRNWNISFIKVCKSFVYLRKIMSFSLNRGMLFDSTCCTLIFFSITATVSPSPEMSQLPMATEVIVPSTQVKISEVDTTKYIHIRQNGTSARVFRETSVWPWADVKTFFFIYFSFPVTWPFMTFTFCKRSWCMVIRKPVWKQEQSFFFQSGVTGLCCTARRWNEMGCVKYFASVYDLSSSLSVSATVKSKRAMEAFEGEIAAKVVWLVKCNKVSWFDLRRNLSYSHYANISIGIRLYNTTIFNSKKKVYYVGGCVLFKEDAYNHVHGECCHCVNCLSRLTHKDPFLLLVHLFICVYLFNITTWMCWPSEAGDTCVHWNIVI